MTQTSAVQIGLERIKLRFLSQLDDKLDLLELQLDQLLIPQKRANAMRAIQAEAHKISGTAPVIGLPELGSVAATVDTAIAGLSASAMTESVTRRLQAQVELLLETGALAVQGMSPSQ